MIRRTTALLLSLAILLAAQVAAPAQEPADPLRLVPAHSDAVLKIDSPGRVFGVLYQHEVVKNWLKIEGIGDFFDTTNYRRLLQLRDFYEKKLGVGGVELLDRLTGGGVAAAVRFQGFPAALLVVQSKDEALLKKFVELTVTIVEQELARQEIKEKITARKFGRYDGYQFGPALIAQAGPTLLAASDPLVMQAALDLYDKKSADSLADQPRFQVARKLLPREPLVWAWVDLQSARKVKEFKTGLDTVSVDPNALFVFGGLVDLLQRTPCVVASLSQDNGGFVLENRMPVGKDGMNAKAALYLPQDAKGSLPLLQPPRTLASVSYFLDLKAFWENRAKLLNPQQLKPLEEFDANSGRFLGGTKLSTLLAQSGPHQRIVVAGQQKTGYKVKPEQAIPAFALVQEMRDPAFAKSMNTILRAGALLGSFQFGLRMEEEKHGQHTVVAYYFNENKPLQGDNTYLRLNYSPAFVFVNDQLIISSTSELAHDLLDEVLKQGKTGPSSSPATTQIALYAKGGADALRAAQDQLLAQAILTQALAPAAARKQIDSFINFVERLGVVRFEIQYGQNDFRHAIRWQYKKVSGE